MIAFCMGGGIGDAILCLPVIETLKKKFGEKFVIFYCDKNLTPILETIQDVELRFFETYWWDSQLACVKNAVSDCDLVIWNRFEYDNDGECNYFYANDPKWIPFTREMREIYRKSLSLELGRPIGRLQDEVARGLMLQLANDSNYYSDWLRFGIKISYDEVHMEVPDEVKKTHFQKFSDFGKFVILHDSRLPETNKKRPHWIKCWYLDRWNELSASLTKQYNCKIVQMRSDLSPKIDGTISHEEIIGDKATFFDYLYLLERCFLYVGTDSWPAHASVFMPHVSFVILKGPSVRRWDHLNAYTSIIRKGNCQGCEYVSLDECVFGAGSRTCMDMIDVESVFEKVKRTVDEKNKFSSGE